MTMSNPLPEDNEEPKWEWPHWADMGTILIAGVFLAGMIGSILWLFSSPTPVTDMFHKKQAAEQSQEVTIDLQQKK